MLDQQLPVRVPDRPPGQQPGGGLGVNGSDLDPDPPPDRAEHRGRAFLDEPATDDHRYPVAHLLDLGEQVTGQEYRRPLRGQAAQQAPDFPDASRVEPVGRLIDDQQRRAAEHRGGDPEPLAHALGVGLDLPGSNIGQAGQAKDPGGLAGTAATARGTEHLEVDPPRHPRVEGGLLDHRAGLRHGPRVGKTPAKQVNLARRRRDQAQQHPDGRGLAGAIRPQKPIDLTGRDGQIKPVHRDRRPEPLGQALAADHIHATDRTGAARRPRPPPGRSGLAFSTTTCGTHRPRRRYRPAIGRENAIPPLRSSLPIRRVPRSYGFGRTLHAGRLDSALLKRASVVSFSRSPRPSRLWMIGRGGQRMTRRRPAAAHGPDDSPMTIMRETK